MMKTEELDDKSAINFNKIIFSSYLGAVPNINA